MRKFNTTFRLRSFFAAAVLVVVATALAFAVPPSQLSRQTGNLTFNGPCCMSFGQSVAVVEPSKPMPVVVTWNAQYTFGQGVIGGLMVNAGPCRFYGSGAMGFETIFKARSYQWVVYPADGLQPGTNTFTLCGGGGFLELFDSTLMVRISK